MTGQFYWIIEPAISLGVFYLAYMLFLRKVTFFRASRYYLLTAILFSLILPHLNFSSPVTVVNYSYFIPEVAFSPGANSDQVEAAASIWTISRMFMIIYFAVAGLLAFRLVIRLLQLMMLVAGNKTRKFNGARIVSLESDQSPFSFLNYIFINETLYKEKERRKIIEHELVHIKQLHTFDLILLELLTIIQWFNPFAWLYRRSILEIHEYLADEEVLNNGVNPSFYQTLLLNLQLGREFFAPASNFNKSLTLNRIKMMTTIKTSEWKKTRFIILFPLLVALVLMCTKNEEEQSAMTGDPGAEITPPAIAPTFTEEGGEIFFIVEEMPGFQDGGQDAFRDYISKNLRYPETARENNIEGRVFVQFMVKADGSVDEAKILRGVDPDLDEEALRVVRSSPKWTPGRQRGQAVNVAFTFPINFVLN